MKAYGIIYFVPELPLPLPVDPGFAGLAAGLGVGVTLFATWAAVAATLRERPAQLMLPRTPKAGKRILLERIGPLWRHLSFSWKVTFRNLFRYKKRFVMTVIGIAGCTALLLTGLGLSNAINDIIDKQFGEITKYNAVVTLADDLSSEEQRRIDDLLDDGSLVTAHTLVMRQNMLAGGPDEQDKRMELVVPEDPASFDRFVALNTRVGHHPVKLDDDGLVLTEKLAAELGVRAGDAVTLTEQDAIGNATGTSYEATVTGIVENYVYHYAYMGPALYEQLMGKAPDYRTVLAVTTLRPRLARAVLERPSGRRRREDRGVQRRDHRRVPRHDVEREHDCRGAGHRGGGARVHRAVQPHEHQHHRAHARDRHPQGARLHAA